MTGKSKTGLFFGSFNPVHTGHLVIAGYMAEYTDLKDIWFVVSPQNPLKEKASLLEDNHRLYMVNLAVEDDPRLKASSIEFHLPKPSYTIDTLTYLSEKYPEKEFVLIAGQDNLQSFHKWKNYEQLLEQYHIYLYPRPDSPATVFDVHPHIHFTAAPVMDISASFIRKSISEGRNMRYFLPEKVWKYIEEMHFYVKRS
ncbi:MAG: nicotinate (nicotinamide) nucleotide adenylyltransferase [Syntrophothermus sp.]